jgi:hemoglobin/transferrin/lactoferrin receptor protein
MKNMGGDDSVSTRAHRAEPAGRGDQRLSRQDRAECHAAATLQLTYEHRDASSSTDMLRLSPSLPRVTSANGTEDLERDRVSLDYEWRPAACSIA